MNEIEIYDRLAIIFREVFQNLQLTPTSEMSANDVQNWDSLSHVDMIVMVEEEFGIKIPSWKIAQLTNVGDLVTIIKSKATSE